MNKNKRKNAKKGANNRLVLWIFGYCIIEIPRAFFEEFLNLCLRYGFSYFDIATDEERRTVSVKVPLLEIENIATACRMWQIRIKVISHHGLPKRINVCRGRWGIVIGAALAIALFIMSQSIIWRVDVIGNSRLTIEEVIEVLEENGLSVGDRIARLKTDSVEQRVMMNNDEIAWMSINITGTVARVEIREAIDTEIKEKNVTPANLISRFDAQILSVEAYTGFVSVK